MVHKSFRRSNNRVVIFDDESYFVVDITRSVCNMEPIPLKMRLLLAPEVKL